ncbi:MAG: peptidase M23, partial [Alphaproteobacteria bacterium HGW-Alphaproteobacteria-2]
AAAERLESAEGARDRVAALTATVHAYEEGLAALREGLRAVSIAEEAERRALAAEEARIAELLGVLSGIERTPAALRLLHPAGPVGAARAGMMLAEVAPALEMRARALRAQVERLALMTALRSEAHEVLRAGLAEAQAARAGLSRAMAERLAPAAPLAEARSARLAALARDARTLEDFAANLWPGGTQAVPSSAVPGRLPLPVRGRLLRAPGEADAAGVRRPGLVLAVPPRALVTAPATGTLAYAGPLLDYGRVALLETAPGILLVFAGLDLVYQRPGAIVRAGEALGLMPGRVPSSEEFLAEMGKSEGASLGETLYIEVRKDGRPVDPREWFETGAQQE